jgi:hypothetical protein
LQFLALPRAECGGFVVDQDRPVREAGRHPDILTVRTPAVPRPAG